MYYAQEVDTWNSNTPSPASPGLNAGQPSYWQDKLSGESGVRRSAVTPQPQGAPSSSCLRAIHLGYQIYQALPDHERLRLRERGRKLASFRKLAANEGIPASTLWRALAVYHLYRRFPELGCYRHLGVAHLSIILGIDEQYQLYFMRMAEIERWSRRRLDREVKAWQLYVSSQRPRSAVSQA